MTLILHHYEVKGHEIAIWSYKLMSGSCIKLRLDPWHT